MKRIVIKIGVLFIFVASFCTIYAICSAKNQEITVIFRYDDYSSRSPINFEIKLIDTFKKYNIPLTVGIIPFICADNPHKPNIQQVIPLTQEKINILKTAIASGIVEPALHGFSHQTIREVEYTEFSSLSYEKQMEKIAKGKKLLEKELNTKIAIFIPPWNSYDVNTLRCLEDLNIICISAGLQGPSDKNLHLKYLPATTTIPELRQAINSARQSSAPNSVIIVLFHSYEFFETNGDKDKFTYRAFQFSNLLSWITSQKDIHVSSMSQIIKENNFNADRFQKNREYYSIKQLLPPFLFRSLCFDGVYFPSQYLSPAMEIRICGIVVSFALLTLWTSAIITFLIGISLFRKFPVLEKLSQYCISVLLIFLLIYTFKNLSIGYKGLTALRLTAITSTLGMNIGVWRSRLKLKNQIYKFGGED
jgi:peptidoglycan/xylan/chitin deacetylase (PgdA/CDA1 family)